LGLGKRGRKRVEEEGTSAASGRAARAVAVAGECWPQAARTLRRRCGCAARKKGRGKKVSRVF
jgi:hypothetical protein